MCLPHTFFIIGLAIFIARGKNTLAPFGQISTQRRQVMHLLFFAGARKTRIVQGLLLATVFVLGCYFLFVETIAKANGVGLILQDNVQRPSKEREQKDEENEGELKGAFFVAPCQQVECREKADGGHDPIEPQKLLVMYNGRYDQNDLQNDQAKDKQSLDDELIQP